MSSEEKEIPPVQEDSLDGTLPTDVSKRSHVSKDSKSSSHKGKSSKIGGMFSKIKNKTKDVTKKAGDATKKAGRRLSAVGSSEPTSSAATSEAGDDIDKEKSTKSAADDTKGVESSPPVPAVDFYDRDSTQVGEPVEYQRPSQEDDEKVGHKICFVSIRFCVLVSNVETV